MGRNRIYFGCLIAAMFAMIAYASYGMLNREQPEKLYPISVIVDNSSSDRWFAFREGLKQAARDYHVQLNIVSTGELSTLAELVLANNDDMALGAIDALKAQNIPQSEWPAVVGIDGTDVGLEAVRNGEMIGTVYNDKEGQAAAMLELAYTLSTDGAVSSVDKLTGNTIRLPYIKVSAKEAGSFTPPGADGY